MCMYVGLYVCMYTCMALCMYGIMYVCMYECMYGIMYVCMYVCMYGIMCVCMYGIMYVVQYVQYIRRQNKVLNFCSVEWLSEDGEKQYASFVKKQQQKNRPFRSTGITVLIFLVHRTPRSKKYKKNRLSNKTFQFFLFTGSRGGAFWVKKLKLSYSKLSRGELLV